MPPSHEISIVGGLIGTGLLSIIIGIYAGSGLPAAAIAGGIIMVICGFIALSIFNDKGW